MATGLIENKKAYSPPEIADRGESKILHGIFAPTLKPRLQLGLNSLTDSFMPYLPAAEKTLFVEYSKRNKLMLLELIELVAQDYHRGTPEFFRAVIALALHQVE